jgi:hypothetical protein
LHVINVIILTAIPYSLASCLISFHFYTHSFPSLHGVLYALPIFHDTSSKNATVSPATTSFSLRHTNTCKNHGFKAVTDDSVQVSSVKTLRHTNTLKNHGYNVVAEVSWASSHVLPRIVQPLPTMKVKSRIASKIFGPYIPYGLFQTKRKIYANIGTDCFRNVDLYKVQINKQTKTNKKPFQFYV